MVGPDAEPMQRALAGERGTMVGRDYRGEDVLAAYRPLPKLDMGLVAKIDLAEVRAPYIRAGLLAGGVGAVLLLVGVGLVGVIGGHLITRLEESEASIKGRQRDLEDALESGHRRALPFTSGYSTVDLGDQELPGQLFLPKPWTAEELLEAVKTVLEGGRPGTA